MMQLGLAPEASVHDLHALRDDYRARKTAVLATLQAQGASTRGITVDRTDLYWVEGGSGRGVFRMSKSCDGGIALQLRRTPSGYDVAVELLEPLLLLLPALVGDRHARDLA